MVGGMVGFFQLHAFKIKLTLAGFSKLPAYSTLTAGYVKGGCKRPAQKYHGCQVPSLSPCNFLES